MKNSLLEHHSEEELWAAYKKTKDPLIREAFIEQYAPLIRYVAGKVAANMPSSVEYDDLVGYGVFGLFDAIDKYDPDKNVKFKTYAVTRVRGAIFDELRSTDWVPRSVRQKTKEIEEAIIQTEAKLGRPASDSEVARTLGLSEEEYGKTMMKISSTSVLSLNDIWYSADESEHMTIGDSIESPLSMNPDLLMERDEIRKVVAEAIKDLPDKEQKVLVLYYYEELTLKEIGKVLNVTESRVSQLHGKAIIKLRARLTHCRKGIV